MTDTTPAPATQAVPLPLFYREPVALNAGQHGDWRLSPGDSGFAGDTPTIPLVLGEIAAASRDYPVVFVGDAAMPTAVVGLERRNLFVAEGRWDRLAYLPAYVRRYPFGYAPTDEEGRYVLAIDAASDRVARGGEAGEPLFESGEPSAITRQALAFCDLFHREADLTRRFGAALAEQDLLVDRRADATLPDGRRMGLEGFRVIDADRLRALADPLVLEWHRNGWLAAAHAHQASLERFVTLLQRQSGGDPAPAPDLTEDAQ